MWRRVDLGFAGEFAFDDLGEEVVEGGEVGVEALHLGLPLRLDVGLGWRASRGERGDAFAEGAEPLDGVGRIVVAAGAGVADVVELVGDGALEFFARQGLEVHEDRGVGGGLEDEGVGGGLDGRIDLRADGGAFGKIGERAGAGLPEVGFDPFGEGGGELGAFGEEVAGEDEGPEGVVLERALHGVLAGLEALVALGCEDALPVGVGDGLVRGTFVEDGKDGAGARRR
jgi:hypothetical protein